MNRYFLELCKYTDTNCVLTIDMDGDEILQTLINVIKHFNDLNPSDEVKIIDVNGEGWIPPLDTPLDEARGFYIECGDYFLTID